MAKKITDFRTRDFVSKVTMDILVQYPCLSVPLIRLEMVEDYDWPEAMAVTEKQLIYNPDVIRNWAHKSVKYCLLHEALHWVQKLPIRIKEYLPPGFLDVWDSPIAVLYNVAADLADNSILVMTKVELPDPKDIQVCIPGVGPFRDFPHGKDTEWYFNKLLEEQRENEDEKKKQENQDSDGEGEGQEGDSNDSGSKGGKNSDDKRDDKKTSKGKKSPSGQDDNAESDSSSSDGEDGDADDNNDADSDSDSSPDNGRNKAKSGKKGKSDKDRLRGSGNDSDGESDEEDGSDGNSNKSDGLNDKKSKGAQGSKSSKKSTVQDDSESDGGDDGEGRKDGSEKGTGKLADGRSILKVSLQELLDNLDKYPADAMPDEGSHLTEGEVNQCLAVSANFGIGNHTPNYMEIAMLKELQPPKIPWQRRLRIFMTKKEHTRPSFSRPNRRRDNSHFLFPSRNNNTLGDVALVMDTSGSMTHILAPVAVECHSLVKQFPKSQFHIIMGDTVVRKEETYGKGKMVLKPEDWNFSGGGGTDLIPLFKRASELNVQAIICLTDLAVPAIPPQPKMPVIWISPERYIAAMGTKDIKKPHYGGIIPLDDSEYLKNYMLKLAAKK